MKQIRIINQSAHLVFLQGWGKDIRLEPRGFSNSTYEVESVKERIDSSILRAIENGMIRVEMTDIPKPKKTTKNTPK